MHILHPFSLCSMDPRLIFPHWQSSNQRHRDIICIILNSLIWILKSGRVNCALKVAYKLVSKKGPLLQPRAVSARLRRLFYFHKIYTSSFVQSYVIKKHRGEMSCNFANEAVFAIPLETKIKFLEKSRWQKLQSNGVYSQGCAGLRCTQNI